MNLRNSVSLACGALLLAGLTLQQANAQVITDTLPNASFFQDANSGILSGSAVESNLNAVFLQAGPTGPAVESLGVITLPMQIDFVYGNLSLGEYFEVFGTGDENTIAGVTSLTLDPGYGEIDTTPLISFGGDFDFTFVGTPSPTVIGTTTIVGGVPVTVGVYGSNFGTGGFFDGDLPDGTGNGVIHVSVLSVPEPGTVSLLAGLAVVGSGLGLRRRRKA
jgi:hypothetical protein